MRLGANAEKNCLSLMKTIAVFQAQLFYETLRKTVCNGVNFH